MYIDNSKEIIFVCLRITVPVPKSKEDMLCCEFTPVKIQQLIGNLGPYGSSMNHSSRCGGDAWYNWKGLLGIF